MKKIFTLIALLMMATWVGWGQDSEPWNGTKDTDWFNDTQSELTITTAEQLAGLANISPSKLKGKIIKLGNNIIQNEGYENYQNWEDNSSDLKEWSPINWETADDLIFDGCGYEIKGVYIINKSVNNNGYGLFSMVGSQTGRYSATIKNLKVTYSYISSTAAPNRSIGGIVGVLSMGATISNCVFDGLIVIDENINHVGGICGSSNGNIENCCNKGDINLELKNISYYPQKGIGGVCGNNMGMPIINCYNEGNITVKGSNNDIFTIEIGGITGYSKEIYGCYNKGSISAPVNNKTTNVTSIGGIAGLSEKVSYCYNQGRITGDDDTNTNEYYKVEDICGGYLSVNSISPTTFVKNYILSTEESTTTGITSATENQFKSGEVAWNLRGSFTIDDETILGFGQDLQDASITSPTLLAFTPGKEVYKLTLDYSDYNINKEKEEKFANSGFLNLPELVAKETEKEVGWYDENGTLYTSTSEISDDITLYAKKQTLHNIIIEATEGGSVSADKKQAIVGKTITLTVTQEEGYALESISATTEEGEPVDITDNTFIMPDADVTVSATFAKVKYTVTIGELTNGSITIGEEGKTEAVFVPGDPVSLNITPDEGYDIDQLFLNDVEITGTTFEMPAANVVVTATFKLKPVEDDDEDTGAIKKRYRLYLADQDFYLNDEYDEAGLVLYSRHDKKYTDVGGSFTVWFEKHGEVNEGARVFISNRANGEYKEVKLDEVSGYYQIRNVQSNIYVKLYTEEGFPVANESIEATDARAYAQANKIVVITPEPTDVQIISMAGAVVASAQVAGQQEFANLAEGVYIVRMGKEIIKLQVRN